MELSRSSSPQLNALNDKIPASATVESITTGSGFSTTAALNGTELRFSFSFILMPGPPCEVTRTQLNDALTTSAGSVWDRAFAWFPEGTPLNNPGSTTLSLIRKFREKHWYFKYRKSWHRTGSRPPGPCSAERRQ